MGIGSEDKCPFRVGVYYWITEYTTRNPIIWSELIVPPDEWPPKPPFGAPPRIGL